MNILEILAFAEANRQELMCLLQNDGELVLNGNVYEWQTPRGFVPDLDINLMISNGIMAISNNFEVSIISILYCFIVDGKDIRLMAEPVNLLNPTVAEEFSWGVWSGYGLNQLINVPSIRYDSSYGYY